MANAESKNNGFSKICGLMDAVKARNHLKEIRTSHVAAKSQAQKKSGRTRNKSQKKTEDRL